MCVCLTGTSTAPSTVATAAPSAAAAAAPSPRDRSATPQTSKRARRPGRPSQRVDT